MGQAHSQSQTHGSVLPHEVVVSILQYLGPQEIKSAVLVCKSLRDMLEKPGFWTWAVITVNTKDDLEKFKNPRLQMMKEIDVTQSSACTEVQGQWIKEEGLADLFQVIAETPTVKRIRGLEFCKGIAGIEPDLLVRVLNSLEELKLCNGYGGDEDEDPLYEDGEEKETQMVLSTEKLELLFAAMAEKTNLKFLQVSGQDMRKDILGEMLKEIEGFEQMNRRDQKDVVSDLIDQIDDTDQVSPQLFAAAVSNVEEVILKEHYKEDITSKQFAALYSIIAAEDRPIKKLTCLSYYIVSMEELDPDLLSRAINKLEEFRVSDHVSLEQMTAILRGVVEGESRLKKLMVYDLGDTFVENLDQNLVKEVKEKIGEFYTGF